MDTTQVTLGRIVELQRQQLLGMQHIAKQQEQLIRLLEERRAGQLRVFLSRTWSVFSRQLATNIGRWAAGLPLWLLALEALGLRPLLGKLLGLYG